MLSGLLYPDKNLVDGIDQLPGQREEADRIHCEERLWMGKQDRLHSTAQTFSN